MCRWMAYSGGAVRIADALLAPEHSLLDQSLHSQLGATTTNGDGFGLGWYDDAGVPRLYRSVQPAWSDANLRELASGVSSRCFFAHIRASTGTAVQQSNTHPFRHGRWLWMHNGLIDGFPRIRRELLATIGDELFGSIEGATDSELMFHLALAQGLEEDPPGAVARMVGLVERTGRAAGIEHPVQMTVATTDGTRTWAFRYSSVRQSRSLFVSRDLTALRALHPDDRRLAGLDPETRLIVSEPLGSLEGAWLEVPESHYGVVQPGDDELHPFAPQAA